jgi:hypothetical protein
MSAQEDALIIEQIFLYPIGSKGFGTEMMGE